MFSVPIFTLLHCRFFGDPENTELLNTHEAGRPSLGRAHRSAGRVLTRTVSLRQALWVRVKELPALRR